MIKRAIMLLLAFVWIGSARANEVSRHEVTSKISLVTVYSDRALVKRTFSAELPAGFVSLAIPALPSKMLNESVRVSGMGTSEAIISGVNIEEEYLESSAQDVVRELEEKLRKIEEQKRNLQDRKGVSARRKSS